MESPQPEKQIRQLTRFEMFGSLLGLGVCAFIVLSLIFSACSALFHQTEGQKFQRKCERDYINKGYPSSMLAACKALGEGIDNGTVKP